jgi:hypothetical protein
MAKDEKKWGYDVYEQNWDGRAVEQELFAVLA